jgi:hypothetical protein
VPSSCCSTHPPFPNQIRLGSASATHASIAPVAVAIIGSYRGTADLRPIDRRESQQGVLGKLKGLVGGK